MRRPRHGSQVRGGLEDTWGHSTNSSVTSPEGCFRWWRLYRVGRRERGSEWDHEPKPRAMKSSRVPSLSQKFRRPTELQAAVGSNALGVQPPHPLAGTPVLTSLRGDSPYVGISTRLASHFARDTQVGVPKARIGLKIGAFGPFVPRIEEQ